MVEIVNVGINIIGLGFDEVHLLLLKGTDQILDIACIGINRFGALLPLCLRLDKDASNRVLGDMGIILPLDLLHETYLLPSISVFLYMPERNISGK